MISRQIIWQDDGTDIDGDGFSDVERGVYVVRNFSSTVRQYELQVRHAVPTGKSSLPEWHNSAYEATADGDRGMIIGFEDSLDVPANVDWNDIRVYARWLSDSD